MAKLFVSMWVGPEPRLFISICLPIWLWWGIIIFIPNWRRISLFVSKLSLSPFEMWPAIIVVALLFRGDHLTFSLVPKTLWIFMFYTSLFPASTLGPRENSFFLWHTVLLWIILFLMSNFGELLNDICILPSLYKFSAAQGTLLLTSLSN